MTGRGSGRRPTRQALAAATIAAAMAWALIGCTNRTPAVRTFASAATAPYGWPMWLLTRSALALLAADPAVRAGLGRSQVYEILPPGQRPVPGVDATLVVTFPAVAALGDALAGNHLPTGTRAVLSTSRPGPSRRPLSSVIPCGPPRGPLRWPTPMA